MGRWIWRLRWRLRRWGWWLWSLGRLRRRLWRLRRRLPRRTWRQNPTGYARRYAWRNDAWWAWWSPRGSKKQTLLRYKQKEREKKETSMLFPALNLLCYQVQKKQNTYIKNRKEIQTKYLRIVRKCKLIVSFFDTRNLFFVYLLIYQTCRLFIMIHFLSIHKYPCIFFC